MKNVFIYYAILIIGWTAAYILHDMLGLRLGLHLPALEHAYWLVAKLVIWILPIVFIIRFRFKKKALSYLSLGRFTAGMEAGAVFGLIFVGICFLSDSLTANFAWPDLALGLVNAVIIAPIFEEIVFRGFILRTLEVNGAKFWQSNIITAWLFLGLHLPGWYFMGSLDSIQVYAVASIVMVGMIAGYAKKRSRSTWGSICFHFINNLYASLIR